jgi:hypothetical protein
MMSLAAKSENPELELGGAMATRSALIERIYGTRDAAWEAWRIEQLRAA